jgi:hypothetical protein
MKKLAAASLLLVSFAGMAPASQENPALLSPEQLTVVLGQIKEVGTRPGGTVPSALQELAGSPYSLQSTFSLVQAVGAMKAAAKESGDAAAAVRLTTIQNRLTLHFDALCLLADKALYSPKSQASTPPPAAAPGTPAAAARITRENFAGLAPDSNIAVTLKSGRVAKGTFVGLDAQGKDAFWMKEPDEFGKTRIDFKNVVSVEAK